jgi:ABC-2 type transport system permease protein
MNEFIWLVRREFWENKAIWVLPACIGGLMVVAALFGKAEVALVHASAQQSELAGALFFAALGGVFWVAMSIYSVWYLLDCLYADRKDRSVLFFKSLPITDWATVLSKLVVGVIAIPLVYLCAADVSALLVAFVISVRARLAFGNVFWRPELWLQVQILWLYVIATGVLWYLPVVGWLLLVSAWAKRAVILQALLPPLAIMLAEIMFLGTRVSCYVLRDRILGGGYAAFHHPINWSLQNGEMNPGVWQLPDPAGFLSAPDVWIGVLIGAAFIAGAVQLRKRRTDNG